MRLSVSLCTLAMVAGVFAIPISTSAEAGGSSTGCLPGVLKNRLAQIRAKFGRVSVISTFRRGARIAGSGRRSFHASCRAVDFNPPRGTYRAVAAWLRAHHGGGVGTYSCGMHHIHIDNGPRIRFHHCVTASGVPIRSYASRRRSRTRYARRHRSRSYRHTRYAARHRGRHVRSAESRFTSERFMTRLRRNGV
jgi:Peptidase M15